MRTKLDPDKPIYVLVQSDGETEVFQFPYRVGYTEDSGQAVTADANGPEELIQAWDRTGSDQLHSTLVEIDARMGSINTILPRF